MLVFLIGYMGAGKSSLATKLAARLDWKKIDTDKEIEKLEKISVSEIFRIKGEQYFRELESKLLRSLDPSENIIVSTGGGLPCFNDNMEYINASGVSFYLKLPAELIKSRLRNSSAKRPLVSNLSTEELSVFVDTSLNNRETYYSKAHFILDATSSFSELQEEVTRKLLEH